MKAEQVRRVETLLDRELSHEETERLERIKSVLGLADDDALWDILAAMEHQRSYYDALPQKIAAASLEIISGISAAAETEAARAQGKLAESVAEQARKLSLRVNMETLLPMGLCALVCLLVYGSLAMWAGFCIGSGQARPPVFLLKMPSGILIGGLCISGGIFLGVNAAKDFAEGGKRWRKVMCMALGLLVSGGTMMSFTI